MGFSDAELSILLIDNVGMQELNKIYRGVDAPTDVLSFPMMSNNEEYLFERGQTVMLGDVAISVEMVMKHARDTGLPVEQVLDIILCHGILHLVGYDHDTFEKAKIMDAKTMELMKELGWSVNAADSLDKLCRWYQTSRWFTED